MILPSVEEKTEKEEQNNDVECEIETIPTETKKVSKTKEDKVDINDKNYPIHKGIIDCTDITKCMEVALPIQLKYSNLISNVTYLEVMSNNHKVLGYYIKYVFKSYQFESHDQCEATIDEVKQLLNDKTPTISCNENGELLVKTMYEEGEYNEKN